ncbi:3-hydroxyacyl-CoA dehydrogenase family protein [Xenorhabdus nematophila]|uniref:3-hydroxyacyl-CoA dehydrogenase involved in xenocoumacin synthesis n=2 Tax=Xenorhabdus TaxID=626 RepID=D3VCB7_XENNA|nr:MULTISPECIES: 3-hydroxyacyl-CoA dehydrogenase family protein [Xenorhabdus]CEE92519.1 3-hydroxyacyl-CoA dehydrogenase involved in xenocoumacin synthesis [Xenorhabdus nematophila str. Anatoliense]CBJ89770.1 3-hydroxyacyl-CoA dehydrogenase involved in xenocoumacin synthesis [Xenorhabdus nematophila ATCC 19061]CCW30972.1 3-hydroxyacyl-CoA dehydrogenase involved in xenocoumacin synthesis [Xenorhabdus nematophila F1]CEE95824.1 3-hydroxyacyl-CoA dehydrogenase involved in xenocoumacin synthesis [Xen
MKISIIGAGVMGLDTAITCAAYGHNISLIDISSDVLANLDSRMSREFRSYRMLKPEFNALNLAELKNRIQFDSSYKAVEGSDWIIENVTEDWSIKQKVYAAITPYIKPETYVTANTSCISITKIASVLPFPQNVLGLHFMNPVPIKKCVEVIQGFHTSEQTLIDAKKFLQGIGKNPVVVEDFPGFVSNRLSHLFMNEAAFLVQDHVASPQDVDRIFKEGYGHAMGPLETADLIGLDTVVNSLHVLYESYQDPKYRCCPLLKKMVEAGHLGRKSGKGFFNYTNSEY